MAQSAHRFGHHAKAWLVAVGACLSVTADAQHDELWVERKQFIGPQTPPFHSTRAKVFYQDISVFDELPNNVLCLGLF